MLFSLYRYMSKKIIITGKKNIDAFVPKKNRKRLESKKWENISYFKDMDMKKQIELLNRLYLNEEYEGINFVEKEVQRKLTSYKTQDLKNGIFESKFIFIPDKKLTYSCGCGTSFSYRYINE